MVRWAMLIFLSWGRKSPYCGGNTCPDDATEKRGHRTDAGRGTSDDVSLRATRAPPAWVKHRTSRPQMPLRAKAMNRALIPQDTSGTVSWPDHPERNDGRELLSLSMDARIPIRKE